MSFWARSARAVILLSLTVAILISSAWLSSRVIGRVSSETELGEISYSIRPSVDGELNAFVPVADWGFRVSPTWTPLSLSAELRAVNRDSLLHLASGDSKVIGATKSELRSDATRLVLEWLALTLVISVLISSIVALVFRSPTARSLSGLSEWAESVRERAGRAHYLPLATIALTIAASAALLLHITLSFNESSFENPSYFARGAELKQLLDSFSDGKDSYVSSLDDVLQVSGKFLADSASIEAGSASSDERLSQPRSLILASDLHSNAIAARALSEFTHGMPVILAGDYGQTGSASETTLMAGPLSGLSDKILAVSGNHDSEVMMDGLEDAGIEDLDDEKTHKTLGMSVRGWPDPMRWLGSDPKDPTRIYSFSELTDSSERETEAQEKLYRWWRRLDPKPEIVVIHQNGLAQYLARELSERITDGESAQSVLGETGRLTILTGHDHLQHIDRYIKGRLTVVGAGTAGAGGPYGIGRDSIGLARLGFLPSGELEAVDFLRTEPISGNSQVDRVRVSDLCPDQPARELCQFKPPVQDLGQASG